MSEDPRTRRTQYLLPLSFTMHFFAGFEEDRLLRLLCLGFGFPVVQLLKLALGNIPVQGDDFDSEHVPHLLARTLEISSLPELVHPQQGLSETVPTLLH